MCDLDMLTVNTTQFPNLEMMKLSTYHKLKGDVVEFEMDVDKAKDYDYFYIFRNQKCSTTSLIAPKNIEKESNISYFGTYYTNNVWIPLDEEIERCQPDPTIYNKILRERIIQETLPERRRRQYINAYYLRIYYDGWKYDNYNIEGKTVHIYDEDLTSHEGWQDELQKIYELSGKKMSFFHNLVLRNEKDVVFFADKKYLYSKNACPKFILDFEEPYTNPLNFFTKYHDKLMTYKTDCLFMYIGKFMQNERPIDNLVKIYDLCMHCMGTGVQLYPMYYYQSNTLNPYEKIMKEVTYYFTMKRREGLFDRLLDRLGRDNVYLQNFHKEMQKEYPIMYEQMGKYSRLDVKEHRKDWKYGEYQK